MISIRAELRLFGGFRQLSAYFGHWVYFGLSSNPFHSKSDNDYERLCAKELCLRMKSFLSPAGLKPRTTRSAGQCLKLPRATLTLMTFFNYN